MTYDAIMIGAGHNGLVCAAWLAKAGKKVLVLERRNCLGGAAATEEVFPGYKFNTGAPGADLFLPEIVEKLQLTRQGVAFVDNPAALFAPQPGGAALTLWKDMEKSCSEVAKFSEKDATRFPDFVRLIARLSDILRELMTLTPPHMKEKNLREFAPLLKSVIQLKRLGKHDMMEFLRVLSMPVWNFLDEWFESETLKAALSTAGIAGSMQGPKAAGTMFVFLHHYLGRPNGGFRSSGFIRGGVGELSRALAGAAQQFGAEIKTGAAVRRILVADDRVSGVELAGGEQISAPVVISNADPRRTFLELVGAPNLGPQFVRLVRNIRFKGTTAKMNLALSGLPTFSGAEDDSQRLTGHIVICPSMEYLERAYDDAKYGRFSHAPYLDVTIPSLLDDSLAPPGQHVMSITMQYAPYRLREGDWKTEKQALGKSILKTLASYAPDITDKIIHQQIITPLDWETEYGLTEGSIYHGQMGLDQLLFMRPVAGWAKYRTPIGNLYLCGAGTHPGGGVTGAPGYNAARKVLKDSQ